MKISLGGANSVKKRVTFFRKLESLLLTGLKSRQTLYLVYTLKVKLPQIWKMLSLTKLQGFSLFRKVLFN